MQPLSDPDLERTQRWMQAFILAPAVDNEAAEAARLVLPSLTLTSLERVGIYRDMYLSRLVEALESDYPALLHYLGQESFHELAARYLEQHPSRSYTLNRLGDHFPEFIGKCDDLPKRDFLEDLARLELALTDVFDEEESPVLTQEAIAAVPPDAWQTACLRPITALRLRSFRYPVSAYLGAMDEENAFPAMRRKQTWVVAYRRQFQVHRLDLKPAAYELLGALAVGTPLGEAVEKSKVREKDLFEWFREWTAEGLFQSIFSSSATVSSGPTHPSSPRSPSR